MTPNLIRISHAWGGNKSFQNTEKVPLPSLANDCCFKAFAEVEGETTMLGWPKGAGNKLLLKGDGAVEAGGSLLTLGDTLVLYVLFLVQRIGVFIGLVEGVGTLGPLVHCS